MPRYWVIAPYHADRPEIWEKVWQFDLGNGIISIGWKELGDVSACEGSELRDAFERIYSDKDAGRRTRSFNMVWNFYHEIGEGDVVIARRGRKRIAAVGTVTQTAYYNHEKGAESIGKITEKFHSNFIGVRWHDKPRDKEYDRIVFGMQTIYEIPETKYKALIEDKIDEDDEEEIKDRTEFILEKYLEEFIVSNFDRIFEGKFVLFRDPEEGVIGRQYETGEVGTIDILAEEPSTNSFVVIELKKGRESDKVVGQTLRYIGWVSENLCNEGQAVKGIIICKDADAKLSYALKAVSNITLKYYRIDFKLVDG